MIGHSLWGRSIEEFILLMHNHHVVWKGDGECPF